MTPLRCIDKNFHIKDKINALVYIKINENGKNIRIYVLAISARPYINFVVFRTFTTSDHSSIDIFDKDFHSNNS